MEAELPLQTKDGQLKSRPLLLKEAIRLGRKSGYRISPTFLVYIDRLLSKIAALPWKPERPRMEPPLYLTFTPKPKKK